MDFFHVNQMLSNIFITEDSNTSQEPSCQLRLGRETWEMDGFPQPPGSQFKRSGCLGFRYNCIKQTKSPHYQSYIRTKISRGETRAEAGNIQIGSESRQREQPDTETQTEWAREPQQSFQCKSLRCGVQLLLKLINYQIDIFFMRKMGRLKKWL